MSIDIDERTLDRIAQRSANAILSCWATSKGGLKAAIVREVKAAIYLDRAAQPAPIPAQTGIKTYQERIDEDRNFIGVRSKEHMFDYVVAEVLDWRATHPSTIPASGKNDSPEPSETRLAAGFESGKQSGESLAGNALTEEAKDAARYRWLRDKHNVSERTPYVVRDCANSHFGPAWLHGEAADQAVDAAIASHIKAGKDGA